MGLLGSLTGKIPLIGTSKKPTPPVSAAPSSPGVFGRAIKKIIRPGYKLTGKNGVETSEESSAAMTE